MDENMVTQVSSFGLRPRGFSNYEKVEYVANLPDDTARLFNTSGDVVVPFADGERVGTVIPVKTISREVRDGTVRHVFYGYYVVFKGGSVHEVLDAGVYERVFAERDKDIELGLPARIVKKFSELDKKELGELASATPPELLLPLHASGQHELVSKVIADMLRRDPMRLLDVPDVIIRKYVVESDDPLVRTAMLENTPAMIKVLETQLKGRGFVEAEKLSYIYYRYWEEELEDEVLEKASRRRPPRRSSELADRLLALGATLPLTVSMVSLPVVAPKSTRKKEEEAEETVRART